MSPCPSCGRDKPECAGRTRQCNTCYQRRYRSRHRDVYKKQLKRWRTKHSVEIAQRKVQYNKAHREQTRRQNLQYAKTWQGFASRVWKCLHTRTINGQHPRWEDKNCASYLKRGIELRMTREDFRSWCESRREEIERMAREGLRPSIDRIDGAGHYSLDNIQVLPLADNIRKGRPGRSGPALAPAQA